MANGTYIDNYSEVERILFLDAQSTSASSPWMEVIECKKRAFVADALETSAKVEIMVSNATTRPTTATDGAIVATLTPSLLSVAADDSYRWWKCKKTEGGTPAASTVIMEADHVGF
jgi:hypothetical protein